MACQWQHFQPQPAVALQRQQLALPAPSGFNVNMGNQMVNPLENFASSSNQHGDSLMLSD